MSGNVNCAYYCNFENNRTSNVRVNQTPGGNSTLSLAWQTNDTAAMRPPTAVRGQYHGRYPSSHGIQRENDENKGLKIGGEYNYFKDNGTTGKVGEKKVISGVRENNNYYNQNNYNNNNNNGQINYEDTYSRPASQQQNHPQKQSYQDAYQQKYLNNNDKPALGRQINNSNNDKQVYNRDAYAPRQVDKQRSISSNQQQQYTSAANQSRQTNTIHDIKFGYRVTQPPGGKSSIIFG